MADNIIKMNQKKDEKESKNEKSFFETILNSTTGGQNNGLEHMGSLLALPDKEFNTLQGFVLNELERELNTSSARLSVIAALEAEGVDIGELAASLDNIYEEIDAQLSDKMDEKRRTFIKKTLLIIINAVMDEVGTSKRQVQIGIELCHPDAKIPEQANPGDAGMDIFAIEDCEIKPGETKLIPTGIKVEIPYGYELQVRPKSGRALKTKMRVANSPGTVDSGYRGEIGIIIDNIEPPVKDITYEFDDDGRPIITSILHGSSFFINKGEKIAQLILNEVPKVSFVQVEHVNSDTERGEGGYGSSGLQAKS